MNAKEYLSQILVITQEWVENPETERMLARLVPAGRG